MAYSQAEVKSGFLITVSLIVLFILTFVVGRFVGGSTRSFQVRFGYISGLEKNAPVHFSGHEVGKVDKIEIARGQERPVLVTVRISDKVDVREDSQCLVDTLGLLGEKFLEITPGTLASPILKPGASLTGTDPIPMHLLIRKMNLLADRMDEMTVSLNPLLRRMDGLVAGHEEEIAKMISNLDETSANLRDMTHDLKFHPWRLLRKG